MTSEIKDQGNDVTSASRVIAHNSTKKVARSIKIGRKVVHAVGDIAHQFQAQRLKVKVTGRINDLGKTLLASSSGGI